MTCTIPVVLKLIEPGELKEHEDVDPSHLQEIYNLIKSDGFFRKPLAADVGTLVVLDGEHRLKSLKMLNCKRIPVYLLDYTSERVEVHSRDGSLMDKANVLKAGLSGKKFPPRTTWHFVRMDDGSLEHISTIEKDVRLPLSELIKSV